MAKAGNPIIVYAAGGLGREIAWLIEACSQGTTPFSFAGYIDDNPELHGKRVNDAPVMSLEEARLRFPGAGIVGAVGAPATRAVVMEKALRAGFVWQTLIHPRTEMSRWVEIGQGTVICAGNILTANIRLGRQVQLNLDCTVGHDVVMGDYATLAPGVHISGCVHLGARVYIGTGAVVINGTQDEPIVVGDDAVIGAGACVTKSVPAGLTVVGVPAKPLIRS